MISTKYKILFIGNCKCASTCIRRRFENINEKELDDMIIDNCDYHPTYEKVSTYLQKRHDIVLSDYFVFSTIRNPWQRMVSLYKYGKPDKNGIDFWGGKWGFEYIKGTSCSFDDYIKTKRYLNSCRNKQILFEDYDVKLYKVEELCIKKILKDIDNHFNTVDYVPIDKTKLKIIDPDWVEMDKIQSEDYKDYYKNPETIKVLSEYYKSDIDFGKYKL